MKQDEPGENQQAKTNGPPKLVKLTAILIAGIVAGVLASEAWNPYNHPEPACSIHLLAKTNETTWRILPFSCKTARNQCTNLENFELTEYATGTAACREKPREPNNESSRQTGNACAEGELNASLGACVINATN